MPLRDTCPICGARFRAGLWRHIEICADRAYREDAEKAEGERAKRVRKITDRRGEDAQCRASYQSFLRGEARSVNEFLKELENT